MGTELALLFVVQTTLLTAVPRALETPGRVAPASSKAKPTSYKEICAAMKKAAEGELKGILGYTEDEVVSSDFIGNRYSSCFDATQTLTMGDKFAKVFSWDDNEWGFSNRVCDLIKFMALKA